MDLPKGFVDLRTASNSPLNSFVDIIGVVVDFLPARLSRTGEHMIYFKLLDLQAPISEALPVRFFKRELHHIPQVNNHGDVVLLRRIKMTKNAGQTVALSNWDTEAIVFPAQGIVAPEFAYAYEANNRLNHLGREPHTKKLSILEQRYVIQLAHDMKETVASVYPPVSDGAPRNVAGPQGLGPNARDQSLAVRSPNVPTGPAAMRNSNLMGKRPGQDLQAPTAMKKSRPNDKFKLVRDLNHRDFADLCVEVVKKFPGRFGECELYVTDYTENKGMYYYSPPEDAAEHERDGDKFNYTGNGPKKAWPGPYGQHVLQVILKHPHADYARNQVSEGDLLHLKNLNAKHNHQHLEGEMWPDRDNPDKVGILAVRDKNVSHVEELLARKDAYWAKRRKQFPEAEEEQQPKKQKHSKTERKKQKKEQLVQAKAAKLEAKQTKEGATPEASAAALTKAGTNPHIRCNSDHVPITSVRDIQDPTNAKHTATTPDGLQYVVPFVNAKYRARVRVVDFRPKQLEDFAHLTTPADEDITMTDNVAPQMEKRRWEWAFSLQLEDIANDASRVWVNLHHGEVQFLLGNLVDDPDDLRQNAQLLARLRETLFSLWGNVEEMRTQGQVQISNRPFECCIAEYGVPVPPEDKESDETAAVFGYRRQYGMFGVTIL